MGVKKQVFASLSERELYMKLCQRWGDRYRIYPNLPFLFVFDLDNLVDWYEDVPEDFTVSEADYARLKKTSIDFTICDDADQPLLCVEFDGMQQGFNTGTDYHSNKQVIPWRRQYTELKLRVALGSLFPFIVIGSQYSKDLSREAQLSILDGIIGDVLANRQTRSVIGKGFDPIEIGYTQEDFDNFSRDEQHEMIQDWVLGIEVEADMEHNPIARRRWSLFAESKATGYGFEFLTYPRISDDVSLPERVKLINRALLNGIKGTVHSQFGDISRTVWIPNFKIPYFSGLTLLEDIAIMLALEDLKRRTERQTSSKHH
ncbi:MAG: PDDEXK family nuclease [Armatimonadota bacterium]